MRGHENIIAMRRAGKSPGWVFLNDYPCKTDWAENGDFAVVCTDGDAPQLLDLRFLVGQKVGIGAQSEARARALAGAAKSAGAILVASCHIQTGLPPHRQDGWAEVWEKPAPEQGQPEEMGAAHG